MIKIIIYPVVIFFMCSCGVKKTTSTSYNNQSSQKSLESEYNSNDRYNLERFRNIKSSKLRVYKDNFEKAQNAFFLDNWRLAIYYLNIVISSREDADAYFMRAYSKSNISDYDGAVSDYLKAINLRPSFVFAYNNLASVKYNYFKIVKSSINDLKKAISYDDNAPLLFANLAIIQIFDESYEKAISNATKAINLGSEKIYDVYYTRGKAKRLFDRFDEAITDLKRSLDYKYDNPKSHFELGIAYFDLEKYDESITSYTNAIRYSSTDDTFPVHIAYENRAIAKNLNKDFLGSISDFNKSNELHSETNINNKAKIGKVHFSWGGELFEDNSWVLAIEQFKIAKDLNPSLQEKSNYNIASSYINLSNKFISEDSKIVLQMNSLGTSPSDNIKYSKLKKQRERNFLNELKYLLLAYEHDKKRKSLLKSISEIYKILGDTENYIFFKGKAENIN
jgi:tetratricopeptide (TPR) repeat protein